MRCHMKGLTVLAVVGIMMLTVRETQAISRTTNTVLASLSASGGQRCGHTSRQCGSDARHCCCEQALTVCYCQEDACSGKQMHNPGGDASFVAEVKALFREPVQVTDKVPTGCQLPTSTVEYKKKHTLGLEIESSVPLTSQANSKGVVKDPYGWLGAVVYRQDRKAAGSPCTPIGIVEMETHWNLEMSSLPLTTDQKEDTACMLQFAYRMHQSLIKAKKGTSVADLIGNLVVPGCDLTVQFGTNQIHNKERCPLFRGGGVTAESGFCDIRQLKTSEDKEKLTDYQKGVFSQLNVDVDLVRFYAESYKTPQVMDILKTTTEDHKTHAQKELSVDKEVISITYVRDKDGKITGVEGEKVKGPLKECTDPTNKGKNIVTIGHSGYPFCFVSPPVHTPAESDICGVLGALFKENREISQQDAQKVRLKKYKGEKDYDWPKDFPGTSKAIWNWMPKFTWYGSAPTCPNGPECTPKTVGNVTYPCFGPRGHSLPRIREEKDRYYGLVEMRAECSGLTRPLKKLNKQISSASGATDDDFTKNINESLNNIVLFMREVSPSSATPSLQQQVGKF